MPDMYRWCSESVWDVELDLVGLLNVHLWSNEEILGEFQKLPTSDVKEVSYSVSFETLQPAQRSNRLRWS